MQPTSFIPIIVLLILLFIFQRNQKTGAIKHVTRKKRTENRIQMNELAKQFINKECLIYAFDSSHQFTGTIKEVRDGAILLENNGQTEIVNLDFVIRIREYPKNKKGKKKSVVLD